MGDLDSKLPYCERDDVYEKLMEVLLGGDTDGLDQFNDGLYQLQNSQKKEIREGKTELEKKSLEYHESVKEAATEDDPIQRERKENYMKK